MKSFFTSVIIILIIGQSLYGQVPRSLDREGGQLSGYSQEYGEQDSIRRPRQQTTIITTVEREVRNWRLTDLFTRADSIAVDTLSEGFQVHSPAYRQAMTNVQLGNIGAPWKAAMISEMPIYSRFLFTDNLSNFFTTPDKWNYYNTRTPYTNLYYQNAPPKSRSEEAVGILFTQNVRNNFNIGANYQLISSIGKYNSQTVNNRHFRFFSSYSGINYEIHGSFVYNKADQIESGGLADDNDILNPEEGYISNTENLRIKYIANNRTDNYQLFVNQSLNIGNVSVSSRDGKPSKLPLGTAFHTLHIDRSKRVFKLDNTNIERYTDYFPKINNDSTNTNDLTKYLSIENIFQVKFNEEANSLLRFGLRGFIGNRVEKFTYPAPSIHHRRDSVTYNQSDTTFVSTYFGGQIFKNLGESFRWNAGAKFYFQGYRTGDSEITGAIDSKFRIGKDTAGIFANGGVFLVSPDFFTEHYQSNHFDWNHHFSAIKTVKVRGGAAIPTRKLELTYEFRLISDYIFWNREALPEQTSSVLKLMEFKLYKHFQLWKLHSRNTALYQLSSHQDILPLPAFSVYSSNYIQSVYSQVLFFQIGFDVRYNSSWYAPTYEPATGQFYIQREREVGDYVFIDAFVNLQLKRARAFFKMSHVNEGLWGNNYFHTIGYPANPRSFRFGVSWNFYD